MRRRRLLLILIIGSILAALLWLTDTWRFRSELAVLRREVTAGHYGTARRHLASWPSRWQGRGDAQFLLGVCEQSLVNTDAALKAWARVAPGSPDADQAVMLRARAVLKNHRFAPAEELLGPMAHRAGAQGVEACVTLAHILKVQGRLGEVIPLLQESWAEAGYPVATLQELWRLDHGEVSIEELRGTLETARRAAPEDDRVWLGLGRLAILTGQYCVAETWLSAVEKRRPDDPVVWRARLD